MQKRGQSDVIKYFITVVVIISIALLGFSLISKVGEKSCKAELARFQIDLKNLDKMVKFGSSQDFTYQVPCDADKVYFFDLNKDINLDFLDDMPLLKDSIKSKAEKNVFVIKDEKIIDSFYAGNLNLGFPGYVCFVPKFEKINFIIEGSGKSASVFPGCFQPECTYIPINSTNEQAALVFNEAKNFGQSFNCPNCPQHVTSEFAFFVQTRENVDIFRKYEYCRETQKTNVEITIRPKGDAKLKQLRFYESIPKFCIDDLQKYLSAIGGEVSIKNDPLIVWFLADVKSEQKLSYVLDTLISDECKRQIQGLGVAELIEKGKRVAVPEIPVFEEEPAAGNTPPIIKGLQNQNINFKQQEQIIIENLWQYGSDAETISNELSYNIKSQSNKEFLDCNIKKNKELWCTTRQNEESYSDMVLEVSDGELTDENGIRINVGRSISTGECGDNICQENEDCTTCVSDCGLCPTSSEFKRLRCEVAKENVCIYFFNNINKECEGFDQKTEVGNCGFLNVGSEYRCSKSSLTECEKNPICAEGKAIEQIPCSPSCKNIEINCGSYPACQNCNNLNFYSPQYCEGDKIFRNFNDFSCINNQCVSSPQKNLIKQCSDNEACINGQCVVQICSDGTQKNRCSANKPKYCNPALNLVDNCAVCGCSSGYECQSGGNCILPAPEQPSQVQPPFDSNPGGGGGGGDGGGGGGRCLLEGSIVLKEGTNPEEIQNLMVGDSIISWDIKNNKQIHTKVTKVIKNHKRNYYYSINNELFITNDHPVLVQRGQEDVWIEVQGLEIGDKIKSIENYTIIRTIDKIRIPVTTVYIETQSSNFIVSGNNSSYIVSGKY